MFSPVPSRRGTSIKHVPSSTVERIAAFIAAKRWEQNSRFSRTVYLRHGRRVTVAEPAIIDPIKYIQRRNSEFEKERKSKRERDRETKRKELVASRGRTVAIHKAYSESGIIICAW